MNIVQINAADAGGGAERSVLTLHQGLLAKGHRATLFVAEKHLDVPGVVKIPYVRGIPGLRRVARWMERHTGWQDIYNPSFCNLINLIPKDTDIVHFNNLWGSAGYADWSILPAITRRWPCVFTERQNFSFTGHCACFNECIRWKTGCGECPDLSIPPAIPKDGTRFNWKRKKKLIGRSDLTFVGISDHVCSLAQQSPIWREKSITRIYNGIDTTTFQSVNEGKKRKLWQRLGMPHDKVAVLLAGQTLEGFQQGIAMEGFQAMNRLDSQRAVSVLVGRSAGEAGRFVDGESVVIPFRETAEKMAECYQACDIALVTSHTEAFGRIPAESQACETPVVAFDSGGLAEVVRSDRGGISVPKGDVDGLVAGLNLLIGDEAMRRSMGRVAREFVVENFQEDRIADQYIALYRKIIAKRRRTP